MRFPFTKAGRAAVNLSLDTQARDFTDGNPAKGILDEGIKNPLTGDFEAYKDALRQGANQADAAQPLRGQRLMNRQLHHYLLLPRRHRLAASFG